MSTSEVNPNVDVTSSSAESSTVVTEGTPSKTTTVGANGNVSFDTLEKALEPTSLTKVKKETPKIELPKATEEQKVEAVAPKEGEETPKVEAETPKVLKVKVGPRGKELELDLDMKLPVTVDGKEVEATLQDLRNDYSGRQAIAKRFSELDARDKAYKADKETTEQQLTQVLSKAYNKDPLGAVLEIVNIAKLDPAPVFEGIRNQLMGDNIEKFVMMSPEQRELHFQKLENQFLRGYKESVEKATSSKQADEALKTELATMRETLKLTDEWVEKAKQQIETVDAYKGLKGNPKEMLKLADGLRSWDLATNALKMVNPEYGSDLDMVELLTKKLQGKPDITVEQAAEMVKKTLRLPDPKATESNRIIETLEKKVKGAPKEVEPEITMSDDAYDPRGWDRI